MSAPIVIAAGGTGGHFFPAEALATELAARGHTLVLMTDTRAGRREHGVFAACEQHVLPGSGVAGGGAVRKLRGILALGRGALRARSILRRVRPAVVVGFGGYPSVPPLLGARLLGRKRPQIVLHEGNAVLGQANALLARFADAIATSFARVAKVPPGLETILTGMPVRAEIAAAARAPFPDATGDLRVLVWGGSLGARVFADVVPQTLAALPDALRARLRVTQQARKEDLERVRAAYAQAGIEAEVAPFFDRVAERLRDAHLVIGRAGGSSVAELSMVGRASIMVPLPIAASDEQSANADALVRAGGGWMLRQSGFTPEALGELLRELLAQPAALEVASRAAGGLGRPDAASALADLVERRIALACGTTGPDGLRSQPERSIPPRAQHQASGTMRA
ncbi:undecaprenyldiphospho-muramoylpentapeptide beta-N-acetylglucosaminyltransferase [Acetobacteraceae bacterium KSS8]|uniref:UDP-N-acetylglucosamine--N-acetylmuramyl-(pentapeptide) pyrophosphoryl-undecaprenol N-acetylglucosamine transferase n=1 Tax=Endosaccharibacter trunci TaxID=2812733 RepID=A0ABT1W445_9PROT|nr:undecaprenyldiphospho-muramoylpentapeptide beta-N-acetylglucosaminyltransferase [Acetobacteraceae bacterium KSS8]